MAELGVIRRGALLLKDGVISSVGPEASLSRSPEARRAFHIDANGKVVMPGFVDSHTHALFAAPRLEEYVARVAGASYEKIARVGGGIQTSAKQVRLATHSMLAKHMDAALKRFLEYGTTTAEVKSGYGLEPAQELKMLRVIRRAAAHSEITVVPTLLIHDIPARLKKHRRRFIQLVIDRLIPEAARHGLAEFCDVFCDRGYFSVVESKAMLGAALQRGLKLKVHAEQLTHSGAARMASGLGAVSADHLDHMTQADIRQLRNTGTIATLLPGSVLHLGSMRFPSARQLINDGVPVALATNFNPGSSPTLNMQLMLSLACSQMRMSPEEAVTAATINGAHALGRGERMGSLEVGKQADVVIMDVSDYREIPYYFGMNHCRIAIKKGRVVYSRGMAS
jgi:imidazolonepropionase